LNDKLSGKIVTNISKEKLYQPAEEYHQYYLKRKGLL
jgi:peptide methionine sulfoxide reductase MsrA